MSGIRNVVMWSGGITSWAAARRIADTQGTDDLVLLFADTKAEDGDLYRWNRDASADIGVGLTVVADGRTPTEVNADERWLGNSRIAPCSKLLKQRPCRTWLRENTDPATTTVHVGIDWTEMHRIAAIERAYRPWSATAPLCEPPYVDKAGWIREARHRGLTPPRMYELGYPHNNCGGVCVRAGQAQWALTLRQFPDRYAAAERAEEEFRAAHGDVAHLTEVRDGIKHPLPLRVLRRRVEDRDQAQPRIDFDDWGGCGCLPEGSAA